MSFLVEAASAAYGETCHYRRPTGGELAFKSLKLSLGLFGHHLLASSGFCWLSCYLPPQPAIPAVIDRSLGIAKEPANSGLLGLGPLSPRAHFLVLGRQITKSLRPTPRIFPFSGDDGGDLVRQRLGGRGGRLTLLSSFLAWIQESLGVGPPRVWNADLPATADSTLFFA